MPLFLPLISQIVTHFWTPIENGIFRIFCKLGRVAKRLAELFYNKNPRWYSTQTHQSHSRHITQNLNKITTKINTPNNDPVTSHKTHTTHTHTQKYTQTSHKIAKQNITQNNTITTILHMSHHNVLVRYQYMFCRHTVSYVD